MNVLNAVRKINDSLGKMLTAPISRMGATRLTGICFIVFSIVLWYYCATLWLHNRQQTEYIDEVIQREKSRVSDE
jgi:hypothetical protein